MIKVLIATIMQNDNRGMHRKMQEYSINKTKEKCVKDSIRKLKQMIENGNRENEGTFNLRLSSEGTCNLQLAKVFEIYD